MGQQPCANGRALCERTRHVGILGRDREPNQDRPRRGVHGCTRTRQRSEAAQERQHIAALVQPCQGRTEGAARPPGDPARALPSPLAECGPGPFGEFQEIGSVHPPRRRVLPGGRELLSPVLLDRRQHAETGLVAVAVQTPQQALFDQGRDGVEDGRAVGVMRTVPPTPRIERESAAGKD